MNISAFHRGFEKNLLFFVLFVQTAILQAQAPWSVNPASFANSGQIEAVVILDESEVTEGYLGAFVGDDCRGVVEGEFFPVTGKTIFSILCYSNASSGEMLSFRYYDDVEDRVYQVQEKLEFVSDMIGDATAPDVLTAVTNSAPLANCPEKSTLADPPGPITIDLCDIFTDPDGDELTFDAIASAGSTINWISGCAVEFTTAPGGTTTLALTATDGELQAECHYSFSVSEVNNTPELISPIGMIMLDEGFGSYSIDLDNVFTDPDGDDLTYTAVSADPAIVTTTVSGSQLSIIEVTAGNTTLSVTASDGEFDAEDESVVIVVASVSQPPWEVNASAYMYSGQIDAVVMVNGTEVTNGVLTAFVGNECRGTVSGAYFKPNGKTIFSLIVYSNQDGGDYLTFRYYDPVNEVVHVVDDVLAFSSDMVMGSANSPVELNVTSDNNLPLVEEVMGDQQVDEHFGFIELEISDVFSDPDGDVLSYSAEISDLSLASLSVNGTTLTIEEAGTGEGVIEVFASDGSLSVSTQFSLTVNNVNDEPIIENSIPDQMAEEGFSEIRIDITGTFSDPDFNVLSYSSHSSDEMVVTVEISGPDLIITEVGVGTTTISVCVNDGEFEVCETFEFVIEKMNQPPQAICTGSSDTIVVEGFNTLIIDSACLFFTDPDEDDLTFTTSSSDDGVVSASFSECSIIITEVGIGSATIDFCATDGEYQVCCEFNFTIIEENELGISVMGEQFSDGDSLKVCEGDSVITIMVASGIPWSVEYEGDWFTAEEDEDQQIVLTIPGNMTGFDRAGSIVVSDTQDHVLEIILFQSANCTPGLVPTFGSGDITIYPNPASQLLRLELSDKVIADNLQIILSTAEGKFVRQIELNDNADGALELDIGRLSEGIYIISVFEFNKPIYGIPVIKE